MDFLNWFLAARFRDQSWPETLDTVCGVVLKGHPSVHLLQQWYSIKICSFYWVSFVLIITRQLWKVCMNLTFLSNQMLFYKTEQARCQNCAYLHIFAQTQWHTVPKLQKKVKQVISQLANDAAIHCKKHVKKWKLCAPHCGRFTSGFSALWRRESFFGSSHARVQKVPSLYRGRKFSAPGCRESFFGSSAPNRGMALL